MMCLGAAGCGKSNGPTDGPASAPADPAKVAAPADAAEPDTGPLVEQLRKRYAERLAGLYYEREQRRIVVRLTGTTPVPPERHTVAGGTVQVVFEPGAPHALADLNRILADSTARIAAALPTAHGRYVDERTGAIVIAIAPDAIGGKAKEAELTQALGVPVRIEEEAPAVPQRQPAQR
ncbi:hypothetical protein [Xanthomonas bundabergensis]|uniref:hypothetical protein n=1 Tax=Xanthomonas bundabergensis TaxID=3160842 RepID=UPI003519A9A1